MHQRLTQAFSDSQNMDVLAPYKPETSHQSIRTEAPFWSRGKTPSRAQVQSSSKLLRKLRHLCINQFQTQTQSEFPPSLMSSKSLLNFKSGVFFSIYNFPLLSQKRRFYLELLMQTKLAPDSSNYMSSMLRSTDFLIFYLMCSSN